MSKGIAVVLGLMLLGLLLLFSTTYTVRFHELAVKTRYGRTSERSVVRDPGLHFRLPFVADEVTTYDTRIRIIETPMVELSTADTQPVVVQAFLMWRVDPDRALDFLGGYETIEQADSSLAVQLHSAVKASLGRYTFDDLIGPSSRLADAEQTILQEMTLAAEGLGVEPVEAGISRIQPPPKGTQAILRRMQATREVLAETERAEGRSEAQAIEAAAKSMAEKFNAFTEQRAAEIRALANADARPYLQKMQDEVELAIFLEWLDTLQSTLSEQTTLFLTDEAAPWHLMNIGRAAEGEGIPQPPRALAGKERPAGQAQAEPKEPLARRGEP